MYPVRVFMVCHFCYRVVPTIWGAPLHIYLGTRRIDGRGFSEQFARRRLAVGTRFQWQGLDTVQIERRTMQSFLFDHFPTTGQRFLAVRKRRSYLRLQRIYSTCVVHRVQKARMSCEHRSPKAHGRLCAVFQLQYVLELIS